ncbi:MAG: hypothetical protein JO099_05075 [Acidobacteriia bacterium]|nr:hypothetical protein [Terriglobia bacterium]
MSNEADQSRMSIADLEARCRGEMIPLSGKFSYFSTVPLAEEDLRHYLQDPIAALPTAVIATLPRMNIILAPYLEKGGVASGPRSGDAVTFERPADNRQIGTTLWEKDDSVLLVFGIKEIEIADYHYQFYNTLAALVADRWSEEVQERFHRTLREELTSEVHGEVDEKSWHLKQALLRRQTNVRKETKLFREYARQSFEDTLTLYLHGTCCDIDVETGPRQMPSRYLRRRLELLLSLYPPPEGYAVLPEQLKVR